MAHAAANLVWDELPRADFGDASGLKQRIAARAPIVLRDLAAAWPALERWAPERLSERFGDREVRVYDASFGAPGPNYMGSIDCMSFAAFLQATQSDGRDLRMFLYNLSQQIPGLLDDIVIPEVGLSFSRRFVFSFFGCKGSVTPLHYDIDMGDVLHTVIRGRRRIRLFAPEDSAALYRHPCTVRSYVDLGEPDFERFPALASACGIEVVLEPGETLYMPAGWWHEFTYLEAGMGVSLRAPSPQWRDRVRGAVNLLGASPLDRVANKLAPNAWYQWKESYAGRNARRLIRLRASDAGTAKAEQGTEGQHF